MTDDPGRAGAVDVAALAPLWARLPNLQGAHTIDVLVRQNGVETRYEADELKYAQAACAAADERALLAERDYVSVQDRCAAAKQRATQAEAERDALQQTVTQYRRDWRALRQELKMARRVGGMDAAARRVPPQGTPSIHAVMGLLQVLWRAWRLNTTKVAVLWHATELLHAAAKQTAQVRQERDAARTALAASEQELAHSRAVSHSWFQRTGRAQRALAAVVAAAERSQWVLANCVGSEPPPNWDALARDAHTAYEQMRDAMMRARPAPPAAAEGQDD